MPSQVDYFFPRLPPEFMEEYDRIFTPEENYNPDYFDEYDYSGHTIADEGIEFETLESLQLSGEEVDGTSESGKRDRNEFESVDLHSLSATLKSENPEYNTRVLNTAQTSPYQFIMSTLFPDNDFALVAGPIGSRVPVPLDSLCGHTRYIMVLCFFAPAFFSDRVVRATSAACSELCRKRADTSVVVVLKMRRDWDNDECAFDQFLSGFPDDSLKVPFALCESRDSICNFLDLDTSVPKGALIDLRLAKILWRKDLSFFLDFGDSTFFPYTDDLLEAYKDAEEQVKLVGSLSLKQLLPITPPFLLERLSGHSGTGMSFSQLNKDNVVIVYLCLGGTIHPTLLRVQQDCKENNKPFDVVLAFPPVFEVSDYSFFTSLVKTHMGGPFAELQDSWWVLPRAQSFRLLRLCNDIPFFGDRLIVVGPRGSFVDTHAADFLLNLGHVGWPFSRRVVVDKFVDEVRKLTLDSFLGREVCSFALSSHVPVSRLKGKNVCLLLIAQPLEECLNVYLPLVRYYDKIKEMDPEFEVVVVPLIDTPHCSLFFPLPWLWTRLDKRRAPQLIRKLFLKRMYTTVLAFGKDGNIGSMYAQELLVSKALDAFPFKGDLHKEVFDHFVDFMNHHGYQCESDKLEPGI